MKLQVETPSELIDINRLPLARSKKPRRRPAGRRADSQRDLAADPGCAALRRAQPRCERASAVAQQGHHQRRLQRTRCLATTSPNPATSAIGSGCAALASFNRIHAILAPAINASRRTRTRHGGGDAGARRQGGDGNREGERSDSDREVSPPSAKPRDRDGAHPGEIVTAVTLPPPPRGAVYRWFGRPLTPLRWFQCPSLIPRGRIPRHGSRSAAWRTSHGVPRAEEKLAKFAIPPPSTQPPMRFSTVPAAGGNDLSCR